MIESASPVGFEVRLVGSDEAKIVPVMGMIQWMENARYPTLVLS